MSDEIRNRTISITKSAVSRLKALGGTLNRGIDIASFATAKEIEVLMTRRQRHMDSLNPQQQQVQNAWEQD